MSLMLLVVLQKVWLHLGKNVWNITIVRMMKRRKKNLDPLDVCSETGTMKSLLTSSITLQKNFQSEIMQCIVVVVVVEDILLYPYLMMKGVTSVLVCWSSSDLLIISLYKSKELEAEKLCSTHARIGSNPRFLTHEQEALTEVNNALQLIYKNIPQLHMANVWVPIGDQCVSSVESNSSCMKLALSANQIGKFMPTDQVHRIHVQAKKGMVGMVLASEEKSCFCRNLCEFSIADQPLSHYEISDRRDLCFAICLQSSLTNDLLYVVEFFLYQGPTTYEYLRSFLNFLLPILKLELKSFKMASGKQLGEELVVEIIEFSDAHKLGFSESNKVDVFPIKFKSVRYSQEEHQQVEDQQTQTEEQHSLAASANSARRERGKRKTGINLNFEVLKLHFGKKLEDVTQELGIGRSTIKRACRECGIKRWPSKGKYTKKPFLPGRESGREMNEESTYPLIAELCRLSLEVGKVFEQAARKLDLELGTFKLKYLGEDGCEILLASEDDFQYCSESQTAKGKTCIQFFLHLKSK